MTLEGSGAPELARLRLSPSDSPATSFGEAAPKRGEVTRAKAGSPGARRSVLGALTEEVSLRAATAADAAAIHRLIAENLEAGHLLPRSIADIEEHTARFVVAETGDSACGPSEARSRRARASGGGAPRALSEIVGCAELAPLSDDVAEVRSLVVDQPFRGRQIGGQLVARVAAAGASLGFATLCAFTHEPAHFVRLGFSIVPHIWVPEKIAHDCTGCALFRRCGQYAVTLPLRAGATVRPERPAAVIQGRGVAARRSNIERLQLQPVAYADFRLAAPKPMAEAGQDTSAETVSA